MNKISRIIFIGTDSNLLSILAKNHETEVVSSISFLSILASHFTPDLIVFSSYSDVDIEEVRKNEKLINVPILILGKDFSELNNLNNIVDFSKVIMCNDLVSETSDFLDNLEKIINKRKSILNAKTGLIVKYAILYINKNYMKQIDRKLIATQLGVTEDYLTRIFHKEMGIKLWKYVMIMRLNRGKNIILTTDKPVSQVALECGFDDAVYFTKVFRETYGKAPLEFKKSV